VGQLGLNDFDSRKTPLRIKSLSEKKVTAIGLGDDFSIALGLTMPISELKKVENIISETPQAF
jgi:hypothetical protein